MSVCPSWSTSPGPQDSSVRDPHGSLNGQTPPPYLVTRPRDCLHALTACVSLPRRAARYCRKNYIVILKASKCFLFRFAKLIWRLRESHSNCSEKSVCNIQATLPIGVFFDRCVRTQGCPQQTQICIIEITDCSASRTTGRSEWWSWETPRTPWSPSTVRVWTA